MRRRRGHFGVARFFRVIRICHHPKSRSVNVSFAAELNRPAVF